MQTLDAHIVRTPGTCSGKPRIAGRRITVQHIAVWHERLGRDVEEIAAEYDLALSDVYAALAYYHDHREEIDQSISADQTLADAMRREMPSAIQEKLRKTRG